MVKQLTLKETFQRQRRLLNQNQYKRAHNRELQRIQHQSMFFVQNALDNCSRAMHYRLNYNNELSNGLTPAQQLQFCDLVCSLRFYQHLSHQLQAQQPVGDIVESEQ